MPFRLFVFLTGILCLFLVLLANSQLVTYDLIVSSGTTPLGFVVVTSAGVGGLLMYVYLAHIKSYDKMRRVNRKYLSLKDNQKN